jgi:hypothetical protein
LRERDARCEAPELAFMKCASDVSARGGGNQVETY